jgi:hypothetical protein
MLVRHWGDHLLMTCFCLGKWVEECSDQARWGNTTVLVIAKK